jgi:hypothetical protein
VSEDTFLDEEEFSPEESLGSLDDVINEIEARWSDLAVAVRGLSDADICRPNVVGAWSIKNVLAHIAAWEQEGARRIDEITRGNGPALTWPSREEEDSFNAAAAAASEGRTVDQVVKSLEEAHQDFMDLLATFGDELMTANLEVSAQEWIPGWTYLHYQEHAPQIWAHKNALSR